MPTRHRRHTPLGGFVLPLALCAVAAYFGWQSTRGDFGHAARETLAAERLERQAELASLVERRVALHGKVKRLRTDALDADLLDERARAKLNLAHPHEIVIVHDRAPELHARALPSGR